MRSWRRFGQGSVADGFLLLDKERGWTSHDVVARCRRICGQRRVGHAGTLDPMATGLLVVAVGRATRLLRYVQDAPKTYEAVAMFGVATDSLDADGSILWRGEMSVDPEELRVVAGRFLGTILQVPPMVSAIKMEGRRLYDLARAGVTVDRPARPVRIDDLTIGDVTPGPYPEVSFRVTCGAGTYVRVLADDLASALGGRAHLVALRRVAIGAHRVADAVTVEDLAAAGEEWGRHLLPAVAGPAQFPIVAVGPSDAAAVLHGTPFAAGPLAAVSGPVRVVDADGALLAMYRGDGRRAVAEVVLA